jgi:predicted RNA-binding protein with RPS1 domain
MTMTTTTVTWGKWTELGKELEKIIKENISKPKPQRKTLLQIFDEFADNHDTTANSASKYYYDWIKPKLNEPSKSFDDGLDDFIRMTKVDPIYRNVKDAHKIGETIEGEVVSVREFGAFVKTTKGFEGLIHISQITKEFVTLPEDFFYVGEKVKAKVLRYDGDKLSLSTRAIGGKSRLNPALKELANAKIEPKEVKVEQPKLAPTFDKPKVEPPKVEEEPKVAEIPKPTTSFGSNDRDNIISFIKRYSDNNVSPKALGDIQDLINNYGVFQTTISLMETVRDLDISSFITEMTKERLEGDTGEYLRQLRG